MKRNSNIAKFAVWIVRFCTDNNITGTNFTDEQETVIRAKTNELDNGLNQKQFYFDCGILTSAAIFNRDALELMVNAIK